MTLLYRKTTQEPSEDCTRNGEDESCFEGQEEMMGLWSFVVAVFGRETGESFRLSRSCCILWRHKE